MEISLESLISYEKLKKDPDDVFKKVEKNGKVVILKEIKTKIKSKLSDPNQVKSISLVVEKFGFYL